jgi:hypothetical protein
MCGEDLDGGTLVCEFRLVVQIFSFLFKMTGFSVLVVRSHSRIGAIIAVRNMR